jgi:RNA polymerase sigma-70 factor, ECF subfamily
MVSVDDDAALVAKCLAGDTEAFRPLVERYQGLLFAVACRMLNDREDAVDAAQTTFVRAFERLDSFGRQSKFFSWLYRILVNECLNMRRARRATEPLDQELAVEADPVQALHTARLRSRVREAVRALPQQYREVIVLRQMVELSYQEIAEVLELPEKTVKSRLYSARQMLGESLLGWKDER